MARRQRCSSSSHPSSLPTRPPRLNLDRAFHNVFGIPGQAAPEPDGKIDRSVAAGVWPMMGIMIGSCAHA
jgi:hypothetical protein